MKKTLIILAVLLVLAGAAQAKLNFGLRSGLNVSKLELSPDGSIDTRSALGLPHDRCCPNSFFDSCQRTTGKLWSHF